VIKSGRKFTIAVEDSLNFGCFNVQQHVVLVLRKIAETSRDTGFGLLTAVLARICTRTGINFKAGVLLAGNHIDHTGNRIGAVDSGSAVLEDLNLLDRTKGK